VKDFKKQRRSLAVGWSDRV
jgi:hypothetical protein